MQLSSLLIFGSFIFSSKADAWQSGDAAKEYSVVVTYCATGLKSLKNNTPTRPSFNTGAAPAKQGRGSSGFKGPDRVN